jgi:hypothetical protein
MLELYQAYADYQRSHGDDRSLFQGLADTLLGSRKLTYQGTGIDLSSFARMSIEDIILANNPDLDPMSLRDASYLRRVCDQMKIPYKAGRRSRQTANRDFRERPASTPDSAHLCLCVSGGGFALSRRNDADPSSRIDGNSSSAAASWPTASPS